MNRRNFIKNAVLLGTGISLIKLSDAGVITQKTIDNKALYFESTPNADIEYDQISAGDYGAYATNEEPKAIWSNKLLAEFYQNIDERIDKISGITRIML